MTVDEYIASFPDTVQPILQRVRETIAAEMPGAEEKIRYDIAAFMLDGRYGLHFAGWKKHVGLYPVPVADGELEAAIAPYRSGKDSVNFPYSMPIPYELIGQIAALVAEQRRAAQ